VSPFDEAEDLGEGSIEACTLCGAERPDVEGIFTNPAVYDDVYFFCTRACYESWLAGREST
jgi:hypothetical protein